MEHKTLGGNCGMCRVGGKSPCVAPKADEDDDAAEPATQADIKALKERVSGLEDELMTVHTRLEDLQHQLAAVTR